ncbi:MAG: hypothetical protein AAB380_03980 [Verrucomicrobiota bacterium]
MNLTSKLDTTFPGQKRILLGELVDNLRHGTMIPRGTFVIMASGDRNIRAKILEKDAPHRGFSVPLPLNKAAVECRITPRYLLWFFSHAFIGEHLLHHATGTVFLRVPKNVLHELPIPVPKGASKLVLTKEVVIKKTDDEFGVQLGAFYDDYVLNVRHGRYHTAIILAGAMAEMIVYQSLLDQGVDRKLLERDHNLGLGKMLTYLKLLKLEKEVPLTHLHELKKKRNAAVHAGSLARSTARFGKSDLTCFDHIVRHYGI